MSIEAMKQALEVLEQINQLSIGENAIALPGEIDAAMDNLRAAIEHYDQTALELCEECGWRAMIPGDGCLVCARQKAKPVAYADSRIHGWPDCFVMEPDPPHTVPLYTEPREWVGLTDEEMVEIAHRTCWEYKHSSDPAHSHTYKFNYHSLMDFKYAIEAKLKEKNT